MKCIDLADPSINFEKEIESLLPSFPKHLSSSLNNCGILMDSETCFQISTVSNILNKALKAFLYAWIQNPTILKLGAEAERITLECLRFKLQKYGLDKLPLGSYRYERLHFHGIDAL